MLMQHQDNTRRSLTDKSPKSCTTWRGNRRCMACDEGDDAAYRITNTPPSALKHEKVFAISTVSQAPPIMRRQKGM
jgi:hypothetical protein